MRTGTKTARSGQARATRERAPRYRNSTIVKEFGRRPRRQNKYNAVKTLIDGITWASKHEAERYLVLKTQQVAGEIRELRWHTRYPLVVNGVKIALYEDDFSYRDLENRLIVEDAKSPATAKRRDYIMKKRLVKALYGIEVQEV